MHARLATCFLIGLLSVETLGATAPQNPATAPAPLDPKNRAAVRLLFNSWNLPVAPRKLVGNIYYVGASGVSSYLISYLITTPQGHILLDTGFDTTVPLIQKNVRTLGFKLEDVRFILSSHGHVDHVGGHAQARQLTGAAIVASAADAHVMSTGGEDDFSPFPKDLMRYTPVEADRIVADGDTVTLGGVTLTAHLTPGHTRGATTWTMDVMEGGKPLHVVFFSSASIVEGTKLLNNPDYPQIAADYRKTFATLKALPCDIFLAPHGGQFAMQQKFTRLARGESPNPLIDPQGWTQLIADAQAKFETQLKAEEDAGR